jgi:hypothetical protein
MEIRTGKRSVLKKYGFRSGGGRNHVRYDHKCRPTHIDVLCPKCCGLAIATDTDAAPSSQFVNDSYPSWEKASFSVKCIKCLYLSQALTYFDIPKPFHEIYVYGDRLWAWNLTHLEMIYHYLNGDSVLDHSYEYFQTYIHGKWKKERLKFARAIAQHMATHNLSFPADATRRSTQS